MLVLLRTLSRKDFDSYNFEMPFGCLVLLQGFISARLWRGNINQRMPDFASLYGSVDTKIHHVEQKSD